MDHNIKLGRFDQSFVVKMIKDFFLLLLFVGALELGIRYGIVLYDFEQEEPEATKVAAERLASDIRDVMINSGGPVAARTLYPIMKRNHQARGLEIAVEPSPVTVKSIEGMFRFEPKGIPADWPEGRYQAYQVDIHADKVCLRCHLDAKVGQSLGRVSVRRYLDASLEVWWKEVRLTGLMSLFKITLDTILLFLLLRVRLEPVLSLRSVVSGLAKGSSEISKRAPVKSADEFGELASDLNLFLDRLTHILEDIRAVLARVAGLNQRLESIHGQMSTGFEKIGRGLAAATQEAFTAAAADPVLTEEWLLKAKALREMARGAIGGGPEGQRIEAGVSELFDQLEAVAKVACEVLAGRASSGSSLIVLADDVRSFGRYMGEMAILEEKMQAIAETGQKLVDRLIGSEDEA